MKKINLILIGILLIFAGGWSGCINASPELPIQPDITVEQITTHKISPGDTILFKLILDGNEHALKTIEVKGTGSKQPAPGSGIVSTQPADKWDFEKSAFMGNTRQVTVLYNVIIGKDLFKNESIDIDFTVIDEYDISNQITKNITIQ